jgi:hypothetical protein
MTNRAYAKSNGDGLLCSILCYYLGSLKTDLRFGRPKICGSTERAKPENFRAGET